MESSTAVFLALSGLSAAKFAMLLSVHRRRAREAELVGHVSDIILYPIKSCKGVQLQQAECTNMGLRAMGQGLRARDRHFMIVTEDGNFLSQRKEPTMALITATIEGDTLHINAPDMDTLKLPVQMVVSNPSTVMACSVWGDQFEGMDCGDEAAQWASAYLKRPVRIVHSAEGIQKRELLNLGTTRFHKMAKPTDVVAFPDIAPYLMTVESSLQDLNGRLEKPVSMSNFRPNIVVKTDPAIPFDEDSWRDIYIGQAGVKLNLFIPCPRCKLSTIDQEKGIKDPNQEPLKTLRTYRVFGGFPEFPPYSPLFGIGLFADLMGNISVGDPVYVTRKQK